jgi:hypothetical protein
MAMLGLTLGVVAAVVLYLFDPATTAIYPVCFFHATTGLLCPGCGTLRALHQLSHGNFAAAWQLNAFTVSLLPVAAWLGLRELISVTTGKRLPGIVTRPAFGWALIVGMVIFGIARNIPIIEHLAAAR